jgi:hypothetical protein
MARVRLRDWETRSSRLPNVCMVCGEKSDKFLKRIFTWYPRWSAFLLLFLFVPGAITMLILTKRMTVQVPFCSSHRRYFQTRGLLMWLPLLGFIILCPLAILLPQLLLDPEIAKDEAPVMWIVLGACLFLVILTVVTLLNTGIRSAEITEESITLVGVNDEFADALDDLRDERRRTRRDEDDEDDDDDDRTRRRRRDEDDDEDDHDRPRQRRRNDDDDDRTRRRPTEDDDDRRRSRRRDHDDAEDRSRGRGQFEDEEDQPRRSRETGEDPERRPARRAKPDDDEPPR